MCGAGTQHSIISVGAPTFLTDGDDRFPLLIERLSLNRAQCNSVRARFAATIDLREY